LKDIDNAINKFIEDYVYKKPRLPLLKTSHITLNLTNIEKYNLNDIFSGQIDSYQLTPNDNMIAYLHGNWLIIYPTNMNRTYTIITNAINTTGTNTWKINIIETI